MRFLLACLLAALVATVLWLFVAGERRAPDGAAQPSAPTAVPGAAAAPPPAAPRAPVRVEPGAPDSGVPQATGVPVALEDGSVPVPPDLSARFAGWTAERMREHLRELELRLSAEQDVAFKQRFDAGLFETHAVHVDQSEAADWDALALRAPQGELGRGRVRFGEPGPDGKRAAQYQFARLPRAEFRELYEHVDERDWLRAELARLGPDDGR
jgi:hypothetical protein